MSVYSDLLDTYVERYNAGDLDGVMELCADDAACADDAVQTCQVRDDKSIVDDLYYDTLALATQIGLIPQTATA